MIRLSDNLLFVSIKGVHAILVFSAKTTKEGTGFKAKNMSAFESKPYIEFQSE
jgi:hypothetical protein